MPIYFAGSIESRCTIQPDLVVHVTLLGVFLERPGRVLKEITILSHAFCY